MVQKTLRAIVSERALRAVTKRALKNLPALVGDFSEDDVTALIARESFDAHSTTTMSLLVDRVMAELPDTLIPDEVGDEQTNEIVDYVIDEEKSPVAESVESLSRSLAQLLSASYGFLRDQVLPTTERVAALVTEQVSEHGFFATPEHAKIDVHRFSWGPLSDITTATESLLLVQNEGNLLHDHQKLHAHQVAHLQEMSSRWKPQPIEGVAREEFTTLMRDAGVDSKHIDMVASDRSFAFEMADIRQEKFTSKNVVKHAEFLGSVIGATNRMLTRIEETPDSFTRQARDNVDAVRKSALCLCAALHAARHTMFKNTEVMDDIQAPEGQRTLILNGDVTDHLGDQVSIESLSEVLDYGKHRGAKMSDLGVSAEQIASQADAARKYMEQVRQTEETAAAGRGVAIFQGAVKKALETVTPEFFERVNAHVPPENVALSIRRAAGMASSNEEMLVDASVNHLVSMTGNPAITRLVSCLNETPTLAEAFSLYICNYLKETENAIA